LPALPPARPLLAGREHESGAPDTLRRQADLRLDSVAIARTLPSRKPDPAVFAPGLLPLTSDGIPSANWPVRGRQRPFLARDRPLAGLLWPTWSPRRNRRWQPGSAALGSFATVHSWRRRHNRQ